MRKKLKDVCMFYSGTGFPIQYQGQTKGEYPFYKVGDIANNAIAGKIYLELCNNYISSDVAKMIKGCILPKDTVVFAKIGEALKLNRRAITSCDCLIDNNAMGIAPKLDSLRIQYFYFCMKNLKMQTLAESTTVPSVRKTVLEKYEIEVPSLVEQEEIEKKLTLTQKIIEKRRQELSYLDEIIKARFVELFGDIHCNNKLPLVKLSEFLNIGSSKRIYANEYVDKGVPFYRSKEIRELGTGMKPSVELYIKQERYDEIKEKYGVPKKGDILIAAIGATIGYSWIVDTDTPFYYKDGNLIILSIKNNVNPIFLNYTMGILIEDFKNKDVAGSAQLALTIEKLEKMMVVNPDIKLQNQFADFVHQVNKSKVAVQKALDETQILFDSLMQKYFG